MRLKKILILTLLATAALMTGCKAKPAPDSGFLSNPDMLKPEARVPFDRSYWDPDYDAKNYTELYVAPVNMDYVMAQNIWEKANIGDLKGDMAKLADYTQQAFIKAAENDPKHHFKIVDKAGPHTLILETALTQLVPSKPALNAVGVVFWEASAVEVAGVFGTNSEDAGKGVVAIEGRLRDGGSGKVLAMFADRERPKDAIINLKSLTWWQPVRAVVDDWSEKLIELSNTPKDKAVKRSSHFDLLIW